MPSTGATKQSAGARRVLKIVSKCNSVPEFITVFQRFCDEDSLFVVTRTPKQVGAESRLAVTLASGKPMLVGAGRVVESFADGSNRFRRPGMRIRFIDLDNDSHDTLEQLNKAREAAARRAAAAGDARPGSNGKSAASKDPKKTMLGSPGMRPPMKIPEIPRIGPPAKGDLHKIESPKVRPEATPPPSPLAKIRPVSGLLSKKKKKPERAATPTPLEHAPTEKNDSAIPRPLSVNKTMAVAAVPAPIAKKPAEEPVTDVEPALPLKPVLTPVPDLEPAAEQTAVGDEDVTNVAPTEGVEEEITRVTPDNVNARASGETSTGEQRTEGSDFILPANPFGEIDEESLEHFVECTLYEETGTIQIGPTGEETGEGLPPWWPEGGGDGSHTPLPPAAPGMLGPDPTGEINPAQMAAAMQARPATATPMPMAAAMPMPMNPNAIAPLPGRRPSWLPLAITAGVTAAVTLVVGYLIFGGGGSSDDEPSAANPPAATAPAAAAPAAAPPAATKPAPAATPPATAGDKDDTAGDDTAGGEHEAKPATPAPVAAATDDDGDDSAGDDDTAGDDSGDDDSGDDDDDDAATAGEMRTVGDGECTLVVTATATNARAYVDDKKIGDVPLTAKLPCDAKLLEVKHPRYKLYDRRLTLDPTAPTEVRALLIRPTVQLRLVSYPAGATVYVGGRKVGTAPLTYNTKGFLRQTVKMVKRGYKPYTTRVYPKTQRTYVRGKLLKGR